MDIVVISLWIITNQNVQIAQDDEGFEIGSVADSLMDSDVEDNVGRSAHTPPGSNPSSTGTTEGAHVVPHSNHRSISPLPAPKPTRPSNLPRTSLDGETIFAVGDEDKWSDESDNEEHERLVSKKS
jgi:hypothetical protein